MMLRVIILLIFSLELQVEFGMLGENITDEAEYLQQNYKKDKG